MTTLSYGKNVDQRRFTVYFGGVKRGSNTCRAFWQHPVKLKAGILPRPGNFTGKCPREIFAHLLKNLYNSIVYKSKIFGTE